MECPDVDKVKPIDELLDDKIREFETGEDKACDKELDNMIWELGDYENEEAPQEAKEFAEEPPIEEELVEKTMTVGRKGVSFKESWEAEEPLTGEDFATASSIGSEKRSKGTRPIRGRTSGKKKK
jgi:hypothetical protein